MENEIIPAQQTAQPFARHGMPGHAINQGAVAIEQERAIAEAQGQLILAKRFPRNMAKVHAEFMDACKNKEFADKAFYAVPNRGNGPSIRFMEEAARCYENFQCGHRELSRSEGKSEIEVYAWDMERNNRSTRQITVLHIRDTTSGPKKLVDQADIDSRIANVASKQVRSRIAALLPKALVEAGIAECRRTLAGTNEKPVRQRVLDMTSAFSRFGVSIKHLEAYLGHQLDETTLDELIDLTGVFNALREGAKASEYFKIEQAEAEDTKARISAIAAAPAAGPAPSSSAEVSKPAKINSKTAKTEPAANQQNKPSAEPIAASAADGAAEEAPPQTLPPVQEQVPSDDGEGDIF